MRSGGRNAQWSLYSAPSAIQRLSNSFSFASNVLCESAGGICSPSIVEKIRRTSSLFSAFPGTIAFPGGESDEDSEQEQERVGKKKGKTGGFQSMGLSSAVYRSVMRTGYRVPTPIQRRAIPAIVSPGRTVCR